jgi:hypothetical protein
MTAAHIVVGASGGSRYPVGVFEKARRKPKYFAGLGRGRGGEHE